MAFEFPSENLLASTEVSAFFDSDEAKVRFRTCQGRGTTFSVVSLNLVPDLVAECREWDRKTPGYTRNISTELVPGPRGGTGRGSLSDYVRVWNPGDAICRFGFSKETDGRMLYTITVGWGLGVKPQRIRPENFDAMVASLEKAYDEVVKKLKDSGL